LLSLAIGSLMGISDLHAYLNGVEATITGEQLYTQPGVVYPPFWYGILTTIIAPLVYLGIIEIGFNILTIFIIKSILLTGVFFMTLFAFVPERDSIDKQWLWFLLLNPVLIITTTLMGQAESPIALGIIAAMYGWHSQRWWLVGAGISLGAVMKFYPIMMFAPLLARRPAKWLRVSAGAAPLFLFTYGMALSELPSSAMMFSAKTPWVTPMSVLGWAGLLGYDILELANLLFLSSVIVAVIWVVVGRFKHEELSLLVPVLPAVYFHTRIVGYRWVPFILAVGYL